MSILDNIYSGLDFTGGELFSATETPSKISKTEWLEKGEWLSAAKRAGAQKLFFVKNNPIVVFAECDGDHFQKLKTFNRIWSLARPRLLFLASPGEITVYDLAQRPFDFVKRTDGRNEPEALKTLYDIDKATQELQNFHRDNIESGKVFEENRFGSLNNRADKSLIRDLKTIRAELIQNGLSGENVKYAHALIGRSIFIRYLEDRNILAEDYFRKVARQTAGWTDILCEDVKDSSGGKPLYPRILKNKHFTYALFRSLSRDFNGDMFPEVDKEEVVISQKHLDLIQGLLYGDTGIQKNLFFYSYYFDVIPLDLISSIYEEFYHTSANVKNDKKRARHDGAFYTPPVLAEFVLSRTLTVEILKKEPRVLDPACGSGIFLVEAFRRIVRYKQCNTKAAPSFDSLKSILRKQIAGIEVNEEAARIAAFSLYLSMLHYLDPPSINEQIKQGNTLPCLIAKDSCTPNNIHCIWIGNTFDVDAIQIKSVWRERFGTGCADVIVGNPPWGAPGKKTSDEIRNRNELMLEWCRKNQYPIGNKEQSQAFLWRALDFLRVGGRASMLVSAGVLLKHSQNSQAFREQWMSRVRLKEVFNFSHVRRFFFKGAISPFIAICFIKGKQGSKAVTYWSAKQAAVIRKTQAVYLSRHDTHILRDLDLSSSNMWKALWFGRLSDVEFIKQLQRKQPLETKIDSNKSGRGFQTYTDNHEFEMKGIHRVVKTLTGRYGPLKFEENPQKVYNLGPVESYRGERLLINEGISERGTVKGQIIARLEDKPFGFSRSIYGIKLKSEYRHRYKLLLGILWSSLSRYYFFSTSTNWGLWYHKLLLGELKQLPVVLDADNAITERINIIVNKLSSYHPKRLDILTPDGSHISEIDAKRREWEAELDEAVFTLYGLEERQKDLVREFCEITIPFFYEPFDSIAQQPAVELSDWSWVDTYIKIFSRRWNAYLSKNEEMRAEIHVGAHGNTLAIEFYSADKGDNWDTKPKNDSWSHVLNQIGKALPQTMGTSRIVLDGMVYVISKSGIIIIKRNIKRFWTRSLAREDAESTLCKAMLKNERGV